TPCPAVARSDREGATKRKGETVRRLTATAAALVFAGGLAATASAGSGWTSNVTATNTVVSSPVQGGGYPVPPGSTKPLPGTCGPRPYNSNHAESWLAVDPGRESLGVPATFFFIKYS